MYRNIEYYPDPTFGEVLKNITIQNRIKSKKESGDLFMKLVYIASPYQGDVEGNLKRVKRYARFACKEECLPMAPHMYCTQFLDDTIAEEREAGMYLGIQMLKRCREIWVFGNILSEGMQREIAFARAHSIPIRYFTTDCREETENGLY